MTTQVNSNWRVGAIVLILIIAGQAWRLHQKNTELKNVFYYDVTVTLVDSLTGEVVKYGSSHGPGSSTGDPIRQTTTFVTAGDNWRISGVGVEPREFGFSARGYKRTNVLVSKDTKSELTVSLDPVD